MRRRTTMGMTVEQRFWFYIGKVDDADACWPWGGTMFWNGYGAIWTGTRSVVAHRLGYELLRGKVPEGLELDHLCRNRACCNPDHLEAVTPRENKLRGNGFSAINARKTHCKRGHELTPENLYTSPNVVGRFCKICKVAGDKARNVIITQRREEARRISPAPPAK